MESCLLADTAADAASVVLSSKPRFIRAPLLTYRRNVLEAAKLTT